MMRSVYFDTSVYNKIVDHSMQSLISKMVGIAIGSGKIEVLFSSDNFEEICHTPNRKRRTQLLKLVFAICKHRFIVSHEELITRELKDYFRDGPVTKEDLYDNIDFQDIFVKAINGILFQGVPEEPFKEMRKKKNDFLEFERNAKKKLGPLWETHKGISFDEFYQSSLRNEKGKELLKAICIRALEKNGTWKQDFSDIDLQKLPGLRCLFKFICGLNYKQLIRGKKPRWGSGIDMNHSVFLGYCDIFVTADTNFLDIVHLFKERNNECLSFNEFMSKYVGDTLFNKEEDK